MHSRKLLLRAGTGAFIIVMTAVLFIVTGRAQSSSPEQPVAFSHRLHAGKYEISCLFCHWRASERRIAGIPSIEKCVDCHKAQGESKPEWKKIEKYWTEQKPVPWRKVNDLPDFVSFDHKRHVRADVSCLNCHGKVYTMDKVEEVRDFTMGGCMHCMNSFFKKADSPPSIDCAVCHK